MKKKLNIFKSGQEIKFATYLKSQLLKIELFLFILSIIAVFLDLRIIFRVSLLILSVLYFLLYFAKYKINPNSKRIISDFILLINCLGRSAAIAGIYQIFSEDYEPKFALLTGTILLVISLLFYIYLFIIKKKDEIISIQEFIRNLSIIILTLTFLYWR